MGVIRLAVDVYGVVMALYIRALSDSERAEIDRGGCSSNATWSRRCRVLRASANGARVADIACGGGWHPESVRRLLREFNADGLDAMRPGKITGRPPWEASQPDEAIKALLGLARESPQQHGVGMPVWTSNALADAAYKQGILEERVSAKCIRNLFARRGYSWKLVQAWQTSPDPDYAVKRGE